MSKRFVIRSRDYGPAYLRLYCSGELQRRAAVAVAGLAHCVACPRICGVDRLANKTAACKTGRYARVSSHFAHFGEEDCLRGWNGSGTIFFGLCNLRCVFCFHPDTLITTEQGFVRIADLFAQASDEVEGQGGQVRFFRNEVLVATRQGTWTPVKKAFCHPFSGALVRVKPYNCPPLLLTPNHEVFVASKNEPNQVRKVRADQLTTDDYFIVPKRKLPGRSLTLDLAKLLSSGSQRFRLSNPRRFSVQQLDQLFAVRRTSFELAQVTGFHPAYVRKLRGQWRRGTLPPDDSAAWVANDIVEEDNRIRFKTERRPGILRRVPLDERFAWLLGIYCAEGHVTTQANRRNSHRLVFSFAHHEQHFVKRTRQSLQDLFGVRPTIFHRRTTITVEVGKSSLALLFARLCGKGARNKQVPDVLRQASPEIVQSFLQGVLEGDGCDRGTYLAVNTISERFALGLFELGLLLGQLPSFFRWTPPVTKVIEGRTVNQSPLFYVKFAKAQPKRRSKSKETENCFVVPLHKIERMPYSGPVYNLEVDDPDHSYLAPFVAVSNCQNHDISQAPAGYEARPERLAEIMLELQAMGCHNINFVTPEHVVPQILEALPLAIERGLRLPLVYNTSAYDALESLRLMDGVVDIYMPDFKIWDPQLALKYLLARDYPAAARAAIAEMHRQVGELKVDERGLAKRGVLVRHLVMPGGVAGTAEVMQWLARELSPDTYVNIMDQYRSENRVTAEKFAEINRRINSREYAQAVAAARAAGLHRFDERRALGETLRV